MMSLLELFSLNIEKYSFAMLRWMVYYLARKDQYENKNKIISTLT